MISGRRPDFFGPKTRTWRNGLFWACFRLQILALCFGNLNRDVNAFHVARFLDNVQGVSTFSYSFLTSCKILGKQLMPIATLANYYFSFWFKLGFVFVLGSRFVFGLRLGFGFGFCLFLLNWIFFRHRLQWAVGYRIFRITAVLCLFRFRLFLGCGAVSSEDRSDPESSPNRH